MHNSSFIKLFCILFLCILLLACSTTTPPETQFYVLTPSVSAINNSNLDTNPKLVIEPIQLANFLDQPGIVLQTDTHQIQSAHYHRWAEPLKRNLHRYISKNIDTQLAGVIIESELAKKDENSLQRLDISIDAFNGTVDGKAILSGFWTLQNQQADTVTKQPFSYSTELKKAGYPELVNKLANLLDQFCADLVLVLN